MSATAQEAPAAVDLAELEGELAGIKGAARAPTRRSYTEEERGRMKELYGQIKDRGGNPEAVEPRLPPAAELAAATEPDRPEGAADDPLTQEQREADPDWQFEEPEEEPAVAAGVEPAVEVNLDELTVGQLAAVLDNDTETYELAGRVEVPAALEELKTRSAGGDEEAASVLKSLDSASETITAEQAQALKDAAGITGDREQAAAEKADESEALFEQPTEYDLEIWNELIGGEQPTEHGVKLKVPSGLEIQGRPTNGLKKGSKYELRVLVQATGDHTDDKLKDGEIVSTTRSRVLEATAVSFMTDETPADEIRQLVTAAVEEGMKLGKRPKAADIQAVIETLIP